MFGENEAPIYKRLVEPGSPKLLTLKDAAGYVGRSTTANSLSHTLSFLVSKGVLERLGRGLYLNKSANAALRTTDLIPWVFRDSPYYVGLNAAANHRGLTPQLPAAYHVIHAPGDEAEGKRIVRWARMLEGAEAELGGTMAPVNSRTPREMTMGTSQAVLDGTQLLLSTTERTVIDATLYTREIGGAGEALLWTRTAFAANLVDFQQFQRILEVVYAEINSVSARLGFLLEEVMRRSLVSKDAAARFSKLQERIRNMVMKTNATYTWGRLTGGSEYFENWRLHVDKDYVNQLRANERFE